MDEFPSFQSQGEPGELRWIPGLYPNKVDIMLLPAASFYDQDHFSHLLSLLTSVGIISLKIVRGGGVLENKGAQRRQKQCS